MEKKAVSGIMLALLLLSMLSLAFNIQPVKAEPRTWIVDDDGPADFSTIQEAINAASPGDTIIVRDGTYTENVDVSKSLTIKSENGAETTIVQAENSGYEVFDVTSDYVNISGFTIEGATTSAGIRINSSHNTISNNVLRNNDQGISVYGSSGNVIEYNLCEFNWENILLGDSFENVVRDNICRKGGYGIRLSYSSGNTIRRNKCSRNYICGLSF